MKEVDTNHGGKKTADIVECMEKAGQCMLYSGLSSGLATNHSNRNCAACGAHPQAPAQASTTVAHSQKKKKKWRASSPSKSLSMTESRSISVAISAMMPSKHCISRWNPVSGASLVSGWVQTERPRWGCWAREKRMKTRWGGWGKKRERRRGAVGCEGTAVACANPR